jgi:hypothetical protein
MMVIGSLGKGRHRQDQEDRSGNQAKMSFHGTIPFGVVALKANRVNQSDVICVGTKPDRTCAVRFHSSLDAEGELLCLAEPANRAVGADVRRCSGEALGGLSDPFRQSPNPLRQTRRRR